METQPARFPRKMSSNGTAVEAKSSPNEDFFRRGLGGKWQSTPLKPSDYADIFGGIASSCSIPVLDLPPSVPEEGRDAFRSSTIDYFDIFGGFDDGAFGVSYDEMFFGNKCSNNGRIQEETRSFQESSDVSESFVKDLSGENNPLLAKGVTKKLSGGNEQFGLSYQMQNLETKESKVSGITYIDEVHALPGVTFLDDDYVPSQLPKADASPVPADRNSNCTMESNGGKVGGNFTKTISPATSSGSTRRSEDDLYADQKPSDLRSTLSEDTSANEQYHSCSSTDQSEFDGDDSLLDLSARNQCSDANGSGGILEGDQRKPASPTPSVTSVNNSKEIIRPVVEQPIVKPISSDDIPSYQHLDSHSTPLSNSCAGSALGGDFTFQGHSANSSNSDRSLHNESTNSCGQYTESSKGKVVKKTFRKTSSLDTMTKNPGRVFEDLPTSGLHHARSFNNSSASLNDESYPGARFLTVSNVNLQTQPSKVPPPSRPPPKIYIGQGPPKMAKTADLKVRTGDGSRPFFDVEVDASSAAAASVAAMREAMEHAQARLKSAKESMERKKDNLQSRQRLAKTEVSTGRDEKVEVVQVTQIYEEVIIPENDKGCNGKINDANDHRPKSRCLGKVAPGHEANERYFDLAEESLRGMQDNSAGSSQVPCIQDDRAAEWKVEEQFFELVNNDKKPEKVQDYFVYEADKKNLKKQKEPVKTSKEKTDKNGNELVDDGKKGDRLAVDKNDGSGDRDGRWKETKKMTEAEEIKEVPEHVPEVPSRENDDKLIDNLVPRQMEEDVKQPECCISCEHDLKISEEANTSVDCKTKPNIPSESCGTQISSDCESEEKVSTSFEDTHAFEEREKLTNVIDSSCLPKHDNSTDRRLKVPSQQVELHECGTGTETIPALHLCEASNEDELLAEATVQSEEALNHEEKKPTSKEYMVPTHEHETKLNGVKESCNEMEHEKRREASHWELNKSETNVDDESPPYFGMEVENVAKEGTCWQYFCEKIIKETQEKPEQTEEIQEAPKLDDELNFFENQQVDIHENHELGNSEDIRVFEGSSNSQTDDRRLESAQEARQSVGNDMDIADGRTATACSVGHPGNVLKTAQEFTESQESDVSGNNISRNLETEERMREERAKKEMEQEQERARKLEEEKEREREREKDRLAFERATREARDRAIAEARERAERAAVERATAEVRQRALTEAREKAERASAEALLLAEKASKEAKLRAERAAVERATAEARVRAVERALAEKAAQEAKDRTEKPSTAHSNQRRKDSEYDMHAKELSRLKQSASYSDMQDLSRENQKCSDSSNNAGKDEGESAIRCKARLERHQRTVERAAKALAEKNLRDILVQREQAERNRFAETLDADVRRWSSGKEGNLRALLSTLQYILGPDSGWQPIPLTDVITAAAAKKAYRKATLCVHPDKVQQRGASIQQKYICEKVFDLLKEAWNRFNSEER